MKTIQEILDEQRKLSTVHEITARSVAASLRGISDETKEKMAISRKGKPSWKKGLSTPSEIVDKLKGKTPWNKDKTGCQEAWNKGLKLDTPAHNKGKSKYIYFTNRGICNNIDELLTAYPEYSRSGLLSFCKLNKHGFSQRLKDENNTRDNG